MTQLVNTPLGVNILGGFLNNTGLNYNPIFRALIGIYTSSSAYTAGSLVSGSVLSTITAVKQLAASLLGSNPTTDVSVPVFTSLVNLAAASTGALANTAKNPLIITATETNSVSNLITCSSTQLLLPGARVSFSGVLDAALLPNTVYYIKERVSGTAFSVSSTAGGPIVSMTGGTVNMQILALDIVKAGFVGELAAQALSEREISLGSFTDWLYSWSQAQSYIDQINPIITAVTRSKNYMKLAYSNMNDLISASVTGVNLSTIAWGQDLIALGRAMDLRTIQSFGLPSNLLQLLKQNTAQTDAVNLALLSTGFTVPELTQLSTQPQNITADQQLRIYQAFQKITGNDLQDIQIILNCQTVGLSSLADLLNPKKLFPNSFSSLTVPIWNTTAGPTNSKTYYFIYTNSGVNNLLDQPNIREIVGVITPNNLSVSAQATAKTALMPQNYQTLVPGFDSYLRGILPSDIATACGALSYSIQQIPHISSVNIEKFAQVVANIETVNQLPLTLGTDVPTNDAAQQTAENSLANGSGLFGTYTFSDFFGAMSGTNYRLADLDGYLSQLNTTVLSGIYLQMQTDLTRPLLPGETRDNLLTPLIAQAAIEINNITLSNAELCAKIDEIWATAEQTRIREYSARSAAMNSLIGVSNFATRPSVEISWINQLQTNSLETLPNMQAQTIEALADLNTVSGQSIVGIMRQVRNQARLNEIGISLDVSIDSEFSRREQSELLANAAANNKNLENATSLQPQKLGVYDAATDKYLITDAAYDGPRVAYSGESIAGSLGDSPYRQLIPPKLNTMLASAQLQTSTYTVAQARDTVDKCNCDCWI